MTSAANENMSDDKPPGCLTNFDVKSAYNEGGFMIVDLRLPFVEDYPKRYQSKDQERVEITYVSNTKPASGS